MWAEKDRRVAGESCSQGSHQAHAATRFNLHRCHWHSANQRSKICPLRQWTQASGLLDDWASRSCFLQENNFKGSFFTQFLFYNWDGIRGLFLPSTLKNKMNGNLPCISHDYSSKLVLGREGQEKQKKGGWSPRATYYLGVVVFRSFENIIEDSKLNK